MTGWTLRFVCASLLSAFHLCFAQFTSNIQGMAEDPSHAAIPGATVKLRNLATQISFNTTTNDSGIYRFSSLQPGAYGLSVVARGFQTKTLEVTLLTAQTADVPLTLTVAGAAETVEVSATAPILDTADSRVQATTRQETL